MVYFVTFLVLFFIFYQDIRYRMIYWFLPVFVFLIPVAYLLYTGKLEMHTILFRVSVNVLIIGLQFGLLYLYIRLKHGALSAKMKFLGLGDVMFILALCSWFDSAYLLLFLVCSFVFSILVSLVFIGFKRWSNNQVPLAGLQALFLIFFLGSSLVFNYPIKADLFFMR